MNSKEIEIMEISYKELGKEPSFFDKIKNYFSQAKGIPKKSKEDLEPLETPFERFCKASYFSEGLKEIENLEEYLE